MALLTNFLLLSASLTRLVESAPTSTANQPMGPSVADRDVIRHRANFCTPFLRRTDGSPMKEDMATYYAKKNCSMNQIFLTLLDTRRGHDLLNELIVQGGKDVSICQGFIAVLSLIDAHNLTEDMCANRVLMSESRSFCDNWQPTDSKAVVQMLTQSRYELLKSTADVLSKLDGKQRCLEVCGGAIDSAVCSSFMDAAKFFSDRVPQELQPVPNRVKEPAWITEVQTGGRGNGSPTPGTDDTTTKVEPNSNTGGTTTKVEPNSDTGGTTMKVEPNSDTGGTTTKVEPNSGNDNGQKFVLDTGSKGSTKEEGVDSAAPNGVGVNDEQSTVSTISWLSSFAQQNNVSEEELQLVMKKLQEKRNQTRLSSQPTAQVSTDDDSVNQEKGKSLPTERPSSAALGELTPAPPPAYEKVVPAMGSEEGATAKGAAEVTNEKLQQKEKSELEKDPDILPSPDSNTLVNDTPSKAVGNGDDREEESDQYREMPGRGDDDFFDTTFDDENEQKWGLEPGLGENQLENTKSKLTAEEQRLAEQQHLHVADEHPPPVADEPSRISPSSLIGKVYYEDHNSRNEEPEQWNCGTWHFFTIILLIAAGVCYIVFRSKKKEAPFA